MNWIGKLKDDTLLFKFLQDLMFELGLHNTIDVNVIRVAHPSRDHLIIAESTSTDAAKIGIAASHTISSLENLKFGLTVEIYLVFTFYTVLPKPNYIFSVRLEPCSPRAFFPSLCYCTVLVVTSAQNNNCFLPSPLHFRIVKAHET